MTKILFIMGPTATGKTDVALELAKKYNGVLVSCDSRQVYKGLDIGTGKLPGKEVKTEMNEGVWYMDGIPVYMYDVADASCRFSVKDYLQQATGIIDDIIAVGKLPIVVGGTGLYLKGLLHGFSNLDISIDRTLREELLALKLEDLQKLLKTKSPKLWDLLNNSEKNNKRRLIRHIEIITMYPYRVTNCANKGLVKNHQVLRIGLHAPRPVLNARIDMRLTNRINQGLLEEGRNLLKSGLAIDRMKELGLEYAALGEYLKGGLSEKEFEEKLRVKIHQYAKRQMTWFKKEPDINWFDVTFPLYQKELEKLVSIWYYCADDSQNRHLS